MRSIAIVGLLGLLISAASTRAERIEDVVRIHTEALGGADRIARIEALRARGRVIAGSQTLEFDLVAQRPNRLRITMVGGGRTLVQGTDGVAPPWRLEPEKSPQPSLLRPTDAQSFAADAEFDDPLVSSPERGYRVDLAGETEWRGRKVLRVLVTRRVTPPSHLLLDPDTYFILARRSAGRAASGREIVIEMHHEDFRPVGGVIYPHRIKTYVDGQLTRETILTQLQVVPPPPPETFAMPAPPSAVAGPRGLASGHD